MKIGILTYHCVPNFGAQLQASSTVGYLKRKGHDVMVINWYPKDLEEMYSKRIPKDQMKCQQNYSDTYLPVSEMCRTENELLEVVNKGKLDAIIVGSDALFKYTPERRRSFFCKRKLRFITRDIISVEKLKGNPFFGGFLNKLDRKIPAYAFSVSSQNCPYFEMTKSEQTQMRLALQNYTMITVRDEWTSKMVENLLLKKIKITPDPVFSFNQNCYYSLPSKEEILKRFHLNNNYLLFSFSEKYINQAYVHAMAIEAEIQGFHAVAFPMPEKLISAGIETRIELPLSPIDWYCLIKYSSGYIGERMHPIVVCLHNSIPFFSFDEYGVWSKKWIGLKKKYIQKSSKTFCILEKAGLEDWLYSYNVKSDLPSPKYIINKIKDFDRDKCDSFAEHIQSDYEKGMNMILKRN